MVRSMLLHLVILSNCILGQVAAQQAERRPTSDSELTIYEVVEKEMHMGHFAQGETLLQNALTENPDDERARFQLGILQFL